MSGHSKWSTIKRKKGVADAKRGKIFTKIGRDIQIAARDGGGDPDGNPGLRLALTAARAANMPRDNQERAIKKGTGELASANIEEALYEGRGPKGAVFMVEVMTDNKNRTVAEVRNVFSKGGGELGSDGSVGWMFDLTGVIALPKGELAEDAMTERAIEAAADDVKDGGEEWIVLCDAATLGEVAGALEDLGPTRADREYLAKPESVLPLEGDEAISVAKFLARLDELDDVHEVFTNAVIPDAVLEEYGP
ncbi:MAG: YebC/PmpR family DNA-binding transcriptional regulator [Nannocystaceae bacterium]|nr:YebC/PmpR family DNA-binding transcriptional regulator [Nannocystaceae bacterium]